MWENLNDRRTIRKYSDREVSEELLNNLLKAACRVSTTGNMQVYSVVVTRDAEGKKRLAPAHFNQPTVTGASVVLTFCADFNRFVKWCELNRAEPGYDNFQSFMTAAIDALLAAQQFCTAAEEAGLGICYLGTTTYNADRIIEILGLPRLVVPVTTITAGYPAEHPDQVERLPLEAIVHQEKYRDYTDDRIRELYKEKEELEINRRYVRENNKETLAQVFTDVRYPKANNEHFSEVLLDVLRKQGFIS